MEVSPVFFEKNVGDVKKDRECKNSLSLILICVSFLRGC